MHVYFKVLCYLSISSPHLPFAILELRIQKFFFILFSSIVQAKYVHNTVHLAAFKINSQTYKTG